MPTQPDPDENQQVAELLAKVTQTEPPNGEDLLGDDEELKRQLREAKAREKNPNGEN